MIADYEQADLRIAAHLLPAALDRAPGAWATLVELLDEDPLLLARATRGQTVLEDAVQDAAAFAWSVDRKFRTTAQAVSWLRARAIHAVRASAGDGREAVTDLGAGWGPDDIETTIDAAAIFARAETSVGDRAAPLLACIVDEATLEEAGMEMERLTGGRTQGLTRERARQCRDALATSLRAWATRSVEGKQRDLPKFPRRTRRRRSSTS